MERLIANLRYESGKLASEFSEASNIGSGTPQEISDYRENSFSSFLERFFPFPYRIAKGNIWDSNGGKSSSIDSIVLNPVHPYTIDSQNKFRVILADGVDAAIELKPDISSKVEMERALRQIQSVKKLRRARPPVFYASAKTEKLLTHICQIPSFIFSTKAHDDIGKTYKLIQTKCKEFEIEKLDQPDFLVVNNRGIIYNHKVDDANKAELGKGRKEGLYYYEQYNEDTLAMFLFMLNSIYPSEIPVMSKMLPYYLTGIEPIDIFELGE